MSDETDKKKRSSTEAARRIWLAGIGVYGRAFTEAQGALKEVTGKGSEVFDDLVQKGEMIEKMAEYKGREILDKTKVGDIEVPSLDIDDRIKRMRERLSMGTSRRDNDAGERLSTLQRLDSIEAKIEALTARLDKLDPPKLKPKTKAKKATTQRTKKASPKTSTAKKSSAKKSS
jgi:polyhydroxyalkanoate synthesis regulator phasin